MRIMLIMKKFNTDTIILLELFYLNKFMLAVKYLYTVSDNYYIFILMMV